ncbi:MAG: Hpt domain-containing protein [Deltaproteobacteria bacterium]|nr:MAG: Hpt domain-containing protein [Deltaproteobacteria bacterium]TNF27859.1 MAG: Hpt domain-containing protein [Deltaproteobacteria bacterium]
MSKTIELPKFYEDLTPPYLNKRKDELKLLHTCFVEGNVDHIQKVAHKIAGSGGSYGLPEISRLGKEIELAAEKNNPQELKELLDTFTDYLESIEVVYKD